MTTEREDELIVAHIHWLKWAWEDAHACKVLPKLIGERYPNPDPCLHNVALDSNLHTFDFWLN